MLSFRAMSRVLGLYLYVFALILVLPLGLSAYFQYVGEAASHPQSHSTLAFLYSVLACVVLAVVFHVIGWEGDNKKLFKRETLVLVVSIWFLTPCLAALPFYFGGVLRYHDALFEAVSGITTTGATVIQTKQFDAEGKEIPYRYVPLDSSHTTYSYYGTVDPVRDVKTGEVLYTGVEAVGKGLLFWRSFLQWLGGVGIIVLFVAVLPALGVGGRAMLEMEATHFARDSMTPRIKDTAGMLWKIYVGLTVLQIVLLLVTNWKMTVFDAVTTTFSTLSTGGFSVKNDSIAGYHNGNTEWVVLLFMILGSVNFSLYFYCMRGKVSRIFEPELFVYLALLFVNCYLVVWNVVGEPHAPLSGDASGSYSFFEAVRYGCFQMISVQTTTGFTIADYDKWPYVSQALLLIAMFMGGMAGSTSGGIKTIRLIILFRVAQYKIESLFRPHAVRPIRVGDREIGMDMAVTVLCFFLVWIVIAVLGTLWYIFDGLDPQTAMGSMSCFLNNIGIAFRMGGPAESFAFLSPISKVVSSLWMLLGRLEALAVLVLLVPAFWKK